MFSVPRKVGTEVKYDIYDVVYEEDLPRISIPIVPSYISSVPANSYADTTSYIRELWTYDDELWIVDYDQPIPALLGLGVGGVENRMFMRYRNIPDMYLPPRGPWWASFSLAANTATTLFSALSRYQQLAPFRLQYIYVANTGTSAASVTITEQIGSLTNTIAAVAVPAGDTRKIEVDAVIRGVLSATASAALNVTLVGKWETPDIKLAIGLGKQYWARVVALANGVTQLNLALYGKRYKLKYVGTDTTPRGEVVYVEPL